MRAHEVIVCRHEGGELLSGGMSAIGTKRTSLFAPHMSAFGGKADIGALGLLGWRRKRRAVPLSDHCESERCEKRHGEDGGKSICR